MKNIKEYAIKFYKQKNGGQPRELDNLTTWEWSHNNKQAFKAGRSRLAKMARHYVDNYYGYNNDSSLVDAKDNLNNLLDGSINTYSQDGYTYSFKVFSKKPLWNPLY